MVRLQAQSNRKSTSILRSCPAGAINTWDRVPFLTTVRNGTPSYVPAVTTIHHNFLVSDGDADGGAIDNDDGSSWYLEHHNFAVYGGAKMGNIDGHAKVTHSNIYAFPNVYGKNCFWNWPGWFPLPGFEETFYDNACIMDAGQSYITLPGPGNHGAGTHGVSKGCDFLDPSSIKVHTHGNKVYGPNGDVLVSGCANAEAVAATSAAESQAEGKGCRLFEDTDCSSGNDLGAVPGPPSASAEECMAECAKNCACAAGVWGKSGSVHRCYLKALPSAVGPIGGFKGNVAFNCTPTCEPHRPHPRKPPAASGLKVADWLKLGTDPGTTIQELPSTAEIIEMGMAALAETGAL